MSESTRKNRHSIRLKDFDYSQAGAYFVTLCTHQRKYLFGMVNEGEMITTASGNIVQSVWKDMPKYHPGIEIDAFVVMPNHIHGIVFLPPVGAQFIAPSLGTLIRGFKARCSRLIHATTTRTAPVWQRNYYDHVIRNETDLHDIREYIENNPLKWELDKENPDAI